MNAVQFTELNTLISVKESTLLSDTDIEKLITAVDDESLHLQPYKGNILPLCFE